MKNKLSPAIVCGFGAAVISTIPGAKSLGCCLLLPGAAILSLYFYVRLTSFAQALNVKTALLIGLLTGLSSAVISCMLDVLITYIFRSNDLVASLTQVEILINSFNLGAIGNETMAIFKTMGKEITTYGFSLTYTSFLLFNNIVIDSLFGMLGGLAGMSFLNKKYFTKP